MLVLGKGHVTFSFGDDPPDFLDLILTNEDFNMAVDDVEALLGNRGARVAVSLDMGDKDFGNGFGAHVTVSLSCNQDRGTIEEASDLAREACAFLLPRALDDADSAYRKYVQSKKKGRR